MTQKQTVVEVFGAQVRNNPDAQALIQDGRVMTYRELDAASNRLANYLVRQGVKKGDLVAFTLDRSIELAVTILAIIKTGAAYVPVDRRLPAERYTFIIEDTKTRLLITTSLLTETLPKLSIKTIKLDAEATLINALPDTTPKVHLSGDDPLYVIYTSGSTGTPKGVVIPHRGITRIAKHLPKYVDFKRPQTLLLQAQTSFDLSVYELWTALLNGARLAIHSDDTTPASISQAIKRYGVTVLTLTTSLYHIMIEEHLDDLRNVECIYTGGDVMLPALTQRASARLKATIINAYGPTENSIMATSYSIRPGAKLTGNVPIGRAVPETTLYILDKNLREVPEGSPGELVVGGQGVGLGYLNRPELTKEKFIVNPVTGDPNDIVYQTGDLVQLNHQGEVEFLGRIDQQVKIRGFRIELGEIENTILKHQNVKACAVVVQEPTAGDKRVVAFVVPRAGRAFRADSLRHYLAKKLPDYMQPAHIMALESLPHNTNGKVDKKALLQLQTFERTLSAPYVAPQNDQERQLVEVWQALLRVQPIGIEDDFFALGGNSLLAARLTVDMQRLLKTELTAGILYEQPTIARLLASLKQQRTLRLPEEVALADDIRPKEVFNPNAYRQSAVLLTGATGFLGAFLIRELIAASPQITIYCLVRAANQREGMKRIRSNLEKYGIWNNDYAKHLKPVAGSLERPHLGLSRQSYEKLAGAVDTVYHNGAKVNYIQSYELHKPANVIGTQNILEFAGHGRTKPVHYLSTAAVFGPIGFLEEITTIYEADDLDRSEAAVSKDIGYIQSKWVAEKILRIAQRRGMLITVHRPGFIMGDSISGVNNTDDYVARLVKGCIQLGVYPNLPRQRKEFVPVDYVARAIVAVCRDSRNFNKAYHIVPPHQESTGLNEFFGAIRATFGYQLEELPYSVWAERVTQYKGHDNALAPFLPLLTEKIYKSRTLWELYENMSIYDSSNLQEALKDSGITYPPFDEQLLRTYFAYMVDVGFLPQPPTLQQAIDNTMQEDRIITALQPEGAVK
ncbi:MAG TPA: amino acid adenylation domain-containing protein [Verrucomicrobiae bacterium]|nr:amino acid adenylation domain-containing protein [Verrucomicrobiae bacterium]